LRPLRRGAAAALPRAAPAHRRRLARPGAAPAAPRAGRPAADAHRLAGGRPVGRRGRRPALLPSQHGAQPAAPRVDAHRAPAHRAAGLRRAVARALRARAARLIGRSAQSAGPSAGHWIMVPRPGRDEAGPVATTTPRTTPRTAPRTTSGRRRRQADPLAAEDPDVLRGWYRQMVLIRRFEERAAQGYTRAEIGGYCHLNLGEEATVVGLLAAMRPDDYLFTNYREHGYAIAKGIEPGRVMAELYGRTTGTSKG